MENDRPLVRLLAAMVAGIAVGRYADVPWSYTWWGVTALSLLLTSVFMRRWRRSSSVLLLAAAMTMGMFLIGSSDARSSHRHRGAMMETDDSDFFTKARQRLSHVYASYGLSDDEYGIVAAMTLGERERVSREVRDVYRASGASHVFALSGMHLGILFMILTFLLPVWRYPRLSAVIQVTLLWMYVLTVGCHASVVRAAVMLSAFSVGKMLSRHIDSATLLFFTASLLLVIVPQWLFSVSFQLSFMAVLSITLIYGRIYNMAFPEVEFHEYRLPTRWESARHAVVVWLWSLLALSLAAQIGTAPLVAHYFGVFSCYSLLANYAVSPLAFLIVILAMLLLLLSFVAGVVPCVAFMAAMTASLLGGTVRILNFILEGITKMPYALIEGIRLNAVQTVLVYVILFCLWRIVVHLYHMYDLGRRI